MNGAERDLSIDWGQHEPSKSKVVTEIVYVRHKEVFERQGYDFELIEEGEWGLCVKLSEWDWHLFTNLIVCLDADARERYKREIED